MKKILVFIICLVILTSIVGFVMAATSQPATATVSVNAFLSITTDKSTITFSNMNPGSDNMAASDNPITVTVGAETNVNVDVETKADTPANFCTDYSTCDGTGTNYKFPVSNMEWSVTSEGTYADYTTGSVDVCTGKIASETCTLYHRISIPDAQEAGTYTTGITITATTTT